MVLKHVPERLASLGFVGKTALANSIPVDNAIECLLPPLCNVPSGAFLMGSDPKRDRVAAKERKPVDRPQHILTLPTYQMARYPVTVAEYACFVQAGQREPQDWQTQLGKLDHPVVSVSWYDALAYADWLTENTVTKWRLPTEAEWEKAARGMDGQLYPWGNTFDQQRCNTSTGGKTGTTPIGHYPNGASRYGVQELAGNVWEWTRSCFQPYPYTATDRREERTGAAPRVLRGGSWRNAARDARAACRGHAPPSILDDSFGFRLVLAST